jgi:Homeodomain-like domain
MAKTYHVVLSPEERSVCEKLLRSKTASARRRTHARILLLADHNAPTGSRTDGAISETARTSLATVARVRRRFTQAGLAAALVHRPQENRKEPVLDGAGEAHLIAMVCSAPPAGHQRWTLHLLQAKLIEHGYTDTISHETVRQRLKKTNLSLG